MDDDKEFRAPPSAIRGDIGGSQPSNDDDEMSIEEIERQLAQFEAMAAAKKQQLAKQEKKDEDNNSDDTNFIRQNEEFRIAPPIFKLEDLIKFLKGDTRAAKLAITFGKAAIKAGASIPIAVNAAKALSRGPEAGVDLSKTAGRQR